MSKTSNRQKTASQSEAEGPMFLEDEALDAAAGGAPSHSQCEPDDGSTSKPKPSRPSRPGAGTSGTGLENLSLTLNWEEIK